MADRGWISGFLMMMVVVAAGLLGCTDPSGNPDRPPTLSPSIPEVVSAAPPGDEVSAAIRQRTGRTFGAVAQLMPGNEVRGTPEHDLLPLLLVEGTIPGDFGEWDSESGGAELRPASQPVVYVDAWQTTVEGKVRDQIAYRWFHRPRPEDPFNAQGVRITVDERGQPMVWEVLADSSGRRVLAVAASLEARAKKEFGAPLPDRAFSVERSVSDAPQVVVARVLDDGPVPMGPWVYLETAAGDVQTLLCRCMPSQTTGPMVRKDYRVAPWPREATVPSWRHEQPDDPPHQKLENALRWPR